MLSENNETTCATMRGRPLHVAPSLPALFQIFLHIPFHPWMCAIKVQSPLPLPARSHMLLSGEAVEKEKC